MKKQVPTFWMWFFIGAGSSPGWKRVANGWVFFHLVVGATLYWLVPLSAERASSIVMIPLVSVFVGLTFAWIANVQAVLMSKEVSALSNYREGGFVEYVFPFQLGVLIVLVCLAAWGLAGVGLLSVILPSKCELLKAEATSIGLSWPVELSLAGCRAHVGIEILLFTLASLSVRECWRLITAAMLFIISREIIRKASDGDSE